VWLAAAFYAWLLQSLHSCWLLPHWLLLHWLSQLVNGLAAEQLSSALISEVTVIGHAWSPAYLFARLGCITHVVDVKWRTSVQAAVYAEKCIECTACRLHADRLSLSVANLAGIRLL
jgi:hypothetical protein